MLTESKHASVMLDFTVCSTRAPLFKHALVLLFNFLLSLKTYPHTHTPFSHPLLCKQKKKRKRETFLSPPHGSLRHRRSSHRRAAHVSPSPLRIVPCLHTDGPSAAPPPRRKPSPHQTNATASPPPSPETARIVFSFSGFAPGVAALFPIDPFPSRSNAAPSP